MDGFAPYLTGGDPLKVRVQMQENQAMHVALDASAELAINIEDLSAIQVKADVERVTYQDLALEDIFIGYKDEQVYLSVADFKGYGTIAEMQGVLNELLPIFNVEWDIASLFADVDFENLLQDASLIKDGDNATVSLPISLGETTITVRLNFETREEKVVFVGGELSVADFSITLINDESVSIADIGEGYHNVAPLFDVMDENGCIPLHINVAGVNALVNFNAATLTADVNLGDLVAKYAEEKVYIDYDGIKASLALADISPAMQKLQPILENYVDLSALETLGESMDVMRLLSGALNKLTMTEAENQLVISTMVENVAVNLALDITDNGYAVGSVAISVGDMKICATPTTESITAISQDKLPQYKRRQRRNISGWGI